MHVVVRILMRSRDIIGFDLRWRGMGARGWVWRGGIRGTWCCGERVWVWGVVSGGGVSPAMVGDVIGGGACCVRCLAVKRLLPLGFPVQTNTDGLS
jgi:hypothetical protein